MYSSYRPPKSSEEFYRSGWKFDQSQILHSSSCSEIFSPFGKIFLAFMAVLLEIFPLSDSVTLSPSLVSKFSKVSLAFLERIRKIDFFFEKSKIGEMFYVVWFAVLVRDLSTFSKVREIARKVREKMTIFQKFSQKKILPLIFTNIFTLNIYSIRSGSFFIFLWFKKSILSIVRSSIFILKSENSKKPKKTWKRHWKIPKTQFL